MGARIIVADVMEGLSQLPDESVHCVVTSPPYFGLRDYGVDGQIGLEPTPAEFIGRLVAVFREARRVLRSDGTCWVNMGDSYAGSGRGGNPSPETSGLRGGLGTQDASKHAQALHAGAIGKNWVPPPSGWKPKDLMGIPWRLAFALQDDGWWLRQDIIWSKPNPMPESVRDRCTKAHEYIFMLTKSERYAYDSEAIKEPATYPGGANSPESIKSPYGQGFTRGATRPKPSGRFVKGDAARDPNTRADGMEAGYLNESGLRNKRSVWTMATVPFPEAHFATFPPELPELCIKAGCPAGGTVLDPFSGAGTTLLVADRLQRNAIGIELNPDYAAMAERRLGKDRGGLLDIMEAAV